MRTHALVAVLFVSLQAALGAAPVYRVIDSGFHSFRTAGAEAAVQEWSRNSNLLSGPGVAKLSNDIQAVQKSLGDCLGYEIMDSRPVGGGSTVVFASARFQHGTLFFRFLVFDSYDSEILNGIAWSSDPVEVFPPQLFRKTGA